jgi:DNA-binding CsgD family transcriptional regulator
MTEAQMTSNTLAAILAAGTSQADKPFVQTELDELIRRAEFLRNLFPSWVFVVCRAAPCAFSYVSDNCQDLLGQPAPALQGQSLERYFARVHPEDAQPVRLCFEHLRDWLKTTPSPDFAAYRFVFHYRVQTHRQQYAYVLDEKHAFRNQYGKCLPFTLLKPVVHTQPFMHVKVEMYKRLGGDYRKVDEYLPRTTHAHPITAREKEVLQCIQEGMTSKQIADKLAVSVFTVRNHRSNIFEKARAENVVQLLNYAQASGWI